MLDNVVIASLAFIQIVFIFVSDEKTLSFASDTKEFSFTDSMLVEPREIRKGLSPVSGVFPSGPSYYYGAIGWQKIWKKLEAQPIKASKSPCTLWA